jgi:hypothetical protein
VAHFQHCCAKSNATNIFKTGKLSKGIYDNENNLLVFKDIESEKTYGKSVIDVKSTLHFLEREMFKIVFLP